MRDISIVWNEYLVGNYITDEELVDILEYVKKVAENLLVLKDRRYQLVLTDLQKEQRKLEQYKAAREERD
jgi:hypothetical protein